MRWYLNPIKLAGAAGKLKSSVAGGGPTSVRITGVGQPRGVILPRVPISLEIVGRDGHRTAFEPELPVGLYLGYGYRLARWLHLPLISDIDPKTVSGEFRIPGR